MNKIAVLSMLAIVSAAFVPTANAAALAGTGCTTSEDSCSFECSSGDTIHVGAVGQLLVDASAICGGSAASCLGVRICAGVTTASGSDNDGLCILRQGDAVTCSSNAGEFVSQFIAILA